MATYKKYQKKPTIVGAQQVTTLSAGNYGILGTLVSNDWIIYLADGTVVSMMASEFTTKYDAAGDNSQLTGSDWN